MKKIRVDFSKKMVKLGTIVFVLLMLGSVVSGWLGYVKLHAAVGTIKYVGQLEMTRDKEAEDLMQQYLRWFIDVKILK